MKFIIIVKYLKFVLAFGGTVLSIMCYCTACGGAYDLISFVHHVTADDYYTTTIIIL